MKFLIYSFCFSLAASTKSRLGINNAVSLVEFGCSHLLWNCVYIR